MTSASSLHLYYLTPNLLSSLFFFFNDTATTEIYTLSLHDALPISFPADAARAGLGWTEVPLICGREIPVPGSLARCVRVLIAWNTPKTQADVRHVFLHGARSLRPSWAVDLPGDAPIRVL